MSDEYTAADIEEDPWDVAWSGPGRVSRIIHVPLVFGAEEVDFPSGAFSDGLFEWVREDESLQKILIDRFDLGIFFDWKGAEKNRPADAEWEDEFQSALARKKIMGWLVTMDRAIVRSAHGEPGQPGSGYSSSWGHYTSATFYGETFFEAVAAGMNWAQSETDRERREKLQSTT